MKTLVIIPTYLEAENIADVLGKVRSVAPHAHVLVVDDASPDGTADLARAAGDGARPGRRAVPPGQGRSRRRLPRRVPARVQRGLRGSRADGRRPLPPARPPARAAGGGRQGGGHRHRLPLRQGRGDCQLAAGPQAPVPHGEHLRVADAGARRARRHRRLPRLPGRHPRGGRGERHQGHRLRLPARAVLPGAPARAPASSRFRSRSTTGSAACRRCRGTSSARRCRWWRGGRFATASCGAAAPSPSDPRGPRRAPRPPSRSLPTCRRPWRAGGRARQPCGPRGRRRGRREVRACRQ